MIYELILIALSCGLMSLYLTAYMLHLGIPCSISDTYYQTERKWLFPVSTATSGVLALAPLLNITPERYQFVAFLIVVSILFVAAAPAFKEEITQLVHYGAASLLGLSATIWLILTTGVPYIAIVGLIIAIIDRRHFLFWIETGLLYNLYASLFYILS